ncbi:Bacillopeptidase F [Anaerolineales bacterium]|nr:Bacillopeptidase F [Anaerolineales bacterium]
MSENDGTNKSGVTALIIGIAVLVCCLCLLVVGFAGYGYYTYYTYIQTAPTFTSGDPIFPVETTEPAPPTELFIPTEGPVSNETLETLSNSIVPENDVYDLACRLQGKCGISRTLTPPPAPLAVGTVQKFWLLNSDTNENFQIDAELLYVTPLTYFWAEKGTQVDQGEVKALMDTFDQEIIPTNREFFGSEWTPGVDGDPHIYVLYAGGVGSNIGGYFSSSDEYNPLVHEYSNGHELFLLSSTQPIGDDYAYSTLAHEFVHMIQFPTDRNDVSWLSEGFAELGAFLNGYDVGGADWYYVQNPDLQLNDWATNDSPDFGAHYGQSFLYVAYFLDRFGEEATKALTANPENDLASIDDTLASLDATDSQTGKALTADDVFMDWAAAMYLKDGSVGDGRYTYHNYPDAPQTTDTEAIYSCPQEPMLRDVHQYGIDYINISCAGEHTLVFTGSTAVQMLPSDPNSGRYAFATNEGNESDMTLTREFDFTNVSGDITFSFHTWYDLEEDFDYLYFEVSEDGQNWQIITTPSGTGEDPSGNSYGWGYNGATNGWMQEEIDLSQYAGKKIQVRFEYVTDAAVLGEGFLLDDVSVDAIGYQTDFETDDGGWQAAGFSRVQNILPQTFRLALIKKGSNGTTVEMLQPDASQYLEIPLSLQDGEQVTLIVSGMTRYTRNSAAYQIEIK